VREGLRDIGVTFCGDSRTALSWAANLSFRGVSVRKAAILFAFITSRFGLQVVETVHVAGVDNDIPDAISRNLDISKKGIDWKKTLSENNLVALDPSILRVVGLCSPLSPLESIVEYTSFWNEAMVEVFSW
jgi:hypothetical protein